MKAQESLQALKNTLEDIASVAVAKGLKAEVICYFTNYTLEDGKGEHYEEYTNAATLLCGTLILGHGEVDESLAYECAMEITDGEIADADMTGEAQRIRTDVTAICEDITEENAKDVFSKAVEPDAVDLSYQNQSNKNFYIACAVGAVVLVVLFALISKLFG